jgi:hypothetical protein
MRTSSRLLREHHRRVLREMDAAYRFCREAPKPNTGETLHRYVNEDGTPSSCCVWCGATTDRKARR